jgi:hypothetical protein
MGGNRSRFRRLDHSRTGGTGDFGERKELLGVHHPDVTRSRLDLATTYRHSDPKRPDGVIRLSN